MIISKEFEWYEDNYLVEADVCYYGEDAELEDYVVYDRDGKDVTDTMFRHMEEEIYKWISNYDFGE